MMLSRRNWIHCSLLCVLMLCSAWSALAQLVEVPMQHARPRSATIKRAASNGRERTLKPMALPFWDDFSFLTPGRPHSPNDTLWSAGANVRVGNNLAINTPTLNAASFDGLDSLGLPYNANDVLANGFTDTLTSRPLLMAGADQATTWLTFFFQWKGNGDPPEKTDYLLVEFKDKDGKWIERTRIYPLGHEDNTVFYDTMLFVAGSQYYHDDFQFRFRSFGRQTGPFDVWNLDQVLLAEHMKINDFQFKDRALASTPASLLGEYRAIPLEHFVQNPQFADAKVDIFNLSWPSSVRLGTLAKVTNYYSGQPPVTYLDSLQKMTNSTIDGQQRKTLSYVTPGTNAADILHLDPLPDSIVLKATVILDSDDIRDRNTDAFPYGRGIEDPFPPTYIPTANDSVSQTYTFKDYYAYDDGTAEYAVYLTNSNNRCVVKFPLLTQDYAYLTSFDVYLPDYGIASNQTMDFLVYEQLPGSDGPATSPTLVINRTVQRTGIDKFFRVPILPPIQVKDQFYIGWIAPSLGQPKIGEDYSNNTGDRIWVNINGVWLQNPNGLMGSLMIRPHVQFSEPPVVGVIPPGTEPGMLTVFPNPCQGSCFIRGSYDGLLLMNSTGQPVPFETAAGADGRTQLSFPTAAPGLYLLRITKGSTSKVEKLIVVD